MVHRASKITRRCAIVGMGSSIPLSYWVTGYLVELWRGAGPLECRREPIRAQPVPMSRLTVGSEAVRRAILAAAPPPALPKYPISVLTHAVECWGKTARFEKLQFLNRDLRADFCGAALRALTEESEYRRLAQKDLQVLLVPSQFGVLVLSVLDSGFGQRFGSPHVGNVLCAFAESGVSANLPLEIAGRGSFSVKDIITDEAARVTASSELEWSAVGLSAYLRASGWRNRFREAVSFDMITKALCERSPGSGPCQGTHTPYSLAWLLNLHGQHAIELSGRNVEAAKSYLRSCSSVLEETQLNDGGWTLNWHRKLSNTSTGSTPSLGSSILDVVTVTGHHLDWMGIAAPEVRPPDHILSHAVELLVRVMPELRAAVEADWHAFPPMSHAARALMRLTGISANEVLRDFADG